MRRAGRVVALLVVLLLAGILARPAPASADVSYIYDALGRLVAVVDSASNQAAIYRYDAVGNLTAIERQSASVVSIIEFNPTSGPVGTMVRIYGTGFSATASQNTVSFNGTVATVSSATSTEIVTSVPAGATTGPISVTAPSGSATSATVFSVGTLGAPTITGFTPTIGAPGTPVTITGTNFDVVANDRVVFNTNVRPAIISSATQTTIQTTVPSNVGSGRLTVATPEGEAISAQDFFVPRSPYTAADVAVANRVAITDSPTVTLNSPGKTALLIFDGTVGQRLSLGITNVTLGTSACCGFYVYLRRPDGTTLASGLFGTAGGVLDVPALPTTGTYTISVEPQSTNTGSATLTFAAEVTGTLVVDGPEVPLSLAQAGQNARVTFTGTAGQRVSLGMTGASFTSSVFVSVLAPNGVTIVSPTSPVFSSGAAAIDLPTLPATGTYTLVIDPYNLSTGSMTVLLSSEITGSIALDGAAYALSVTRAGQNARLTFDGTAGQRVSLALSGVTIPCCSATAYLLKPDGTTLSSSGFASAGAVIDAPALPTSGTYTVFVDPFGGTTGNATLTLSSEQTGTIAIDGASLPVSLPRPGQNARVTFTGTAGQRVSLAMTGASFTSSVFISVLAPNGVTFLSPTSPFFSGGSAVIDLPTLPATGTYTLVIDPYNLSTGSMTLLLSSEIAGSIALDGAAYALSVTRAGQNARLTFDGTAGQRVSLALSGVTIPCCSATAYLLKPDGTTLSSSGFASAGAVIDAPALPTTGTYAIFIDPWGATTGNVTLTLSQELTGTVVINGSGVTLTTRVGQNGRLTFEGTAGQQVTVRMTGNSMSSVTVKLLRPDGSSMTSLMSANTSFNLTPQTLATSGTYTVTIDPYSLNTGSITIAVTSP